MSEISKHSTLSDLQLLSQLLEPIFYYDVFLHPLRLEEIHQYANYKQEQCIEDTADSLKQAIAAGYLFVDEGYYQLAANPTSIQRRIDNNRRAHKYIKRAQRISKFMLYFPFVRAVFVSGSLSKNVMPQDGDIDYFIVTKPGRLWIARTLLILFKKIILFNSYKYFCVNYFVDEKMLEIEEKNRFTATEIATILPMQGQAIYQQFIDANTWIHRFYPNHQFQDASTVSKHKRGFIQGGLEFLLNNALGDKLDDYFMKRTLLHWRGKFPHLDHQDFELALKTHKGVSKHHPQLFQNKVIAAFEQRIKQFEQHHQLSLNITTR